MNLNCAHALLGNSCVIGSGHLPNPVVIMANWSAEHRVFCVRTFFQCKSVVKVQKAFRVHFKIARHGSIPTRNTILKWVERFNATGKVTDQ
jgi:hypothetical protein